MDNYSWNIRVDLHNPPSNASQIAGVLKAWLGQRLHAARAPSQPRSLMKSQNATGATSPEDQRIITVLQEREKESNMHLGASNPAQKHTSNIVIHTNSLQKFSSVDGRFD